MFLEGSTPTFQYLGVEGANVLPGAQRAKLCGSYFWLGCSYFLVMCSFFFDNLRETVMLLATVKRDARAQKSPTHAYRCNYSSKYSSVLALPATFITCSVPAPHFLPLKLHFWRPLVLTFTIPDKTAHS